MICIFDANADANELLISTYAIMTSVYLTHMYEIKRLFIEEKRLKIK